MRTKSQKVAAGLLGLAIIAFVVDRWVIGIEDEGAAGATAPVRATVAAPAGAAAKPAAQPATVEAVAAQPTGQPTGQPASLASRLAALDEAMRLSREAIANAFRPSDAWIAAAAPPVVTPPKAEVVPPRPAAPKVDHAAVFARRHKLTAVINDGRRGMAIVNGRLYKVGQRVGGFKLIDVGLTEAVFLGMGTEATLHLPGQSSPSLAGVQ